MNSKLYIFMLCLLTFPVNSHSESLSSDYSKRTLFRLKWGSEKSEIGYSENLSGFEGSHGGPSAIDVDNEGNVIILDSVNNYIKTFNQNGDII